MEHNLIFATNPSRFSVTAINEDSDGEISDGMDDMDHEEFVQIYLQKNGDNIEESLHNSYNGGNDHVAEQGKLLLYYNL